MRGTLRVRRAAFLVLAGLLAGGPVFAQGSAQGSSQGSSQLPWETKATAEDGKGSGLSLPVALFVLEPATGYGMYTARNGKTFGKGDPLFFYLEPAGYGYAREGELHRFGATIDLKILQDGKPVFSKDGFLDARFTSHHPNKEINFSGRLTLDGAPKGEYELQLLVRDAITGGTATATLPFSLE